MSGEAVRTAPTALDRYRALVCGIPQRLREDKLIVLFKAFVDESGHDPSQSHFVLGGYLSSVAHWDRFTEEWDHWMRAWRIDPKKGFHMTEAEALDHDYSAWDPATKDCRIATLSRIVSRHIVRGFACDVRRADYSWHVARTALGQEKVRKQLRSPYLSSVLIMLDGIEKACAARGVALDDLHFVFADQGRLPEWERASIRKTCDNLGLRQPTFTPASELAPLQAADMLAWRIYQSATRNPRMNPVPPRHRPLLTRLWVHRITPKTLEILRAGTAFRIRERRGRAR